MPQTFKKLPSFVPATYRLHDLPEAGIPTAVVTDGPNAGLVYVAALPQLGGSDVMFHPELAADSAFSKAQDGNPTGTCNQQGLSVYLSEFNRHEGMTMHHSSHWGVTNKALLELRPQREIEQLFFSFDAADPSSGHGWLRAEVQLRFAAWRDGPHHARQSAFDTADYPKIAATAGCNFDTNY